MLYSNSHQEDTVVMRKMLITASFLLLAAGAAACKSAPPETAAPAETTAVPAETAAPAAPAVPEVPSVPTAPVQPAAPAPAPQPAISSYLYIDTESADANGNGRIDYIASLRSTEGSSVKEASDAAWATGASSYGKTYSVWESPYGLCAYVKSAGSESYIIDEAAIIALINTYGISRSLVPYNSLVH